MVTITAKLTFIESILGTLPNNKEVFTDFIASKAPDAATIEDEVAALGEDAVAEKGTTVFPITQDGEPFLYDYQMKGFFKGACGFLRNVSGSKSKDMTAYKKKIDGNIFVYAAGKRPNASLDNAWKRIIFEGDYTLDTNQRPLRAQTMQGERVSLARSEEISVGATLTMDIVMLDNGMEKYVREWLDYGVYSGIGQWRNSGHGRFVWEELNYVNDGGEDSEGAPKKRGRKPKAEEPAA